MGRSGFCGSGFWFGVGEALLVPLAFTLFGLAWWGVALRAEAGAGSYPARVSAPAETWLVDGFNVVQVGLLGGRERSEWWTAPRRAELMARVEAFDAEQAEIWVVFDGGRPGPAEGSQRTRSVFVPSADEWLVARVREAPDPDRIRVVTADRRLAARVRHHGGRVVPPAEFLGRCGGGGRSMEISL